MKKNDLEALKTRYLPAVRVGGKILLASWIIYTVGWYLIAQMLSFQKVRYIDSLQQLGYRFRYQDIAVSGYPFYFNTAIDTPSYENADKTFGWRTDNAKIELRNLQSNDIQINFSSLHRFAFKSDTQENPIPGLLKTESAKFFFDFANDAGKSGAKIKLSAPIVKVGEERVFSADKAEVLFNEKELYTNQTVSPVLQLTINAKNLHFSQKWRGILEKPFDVFSAKLTVKNPSDFNQAAQFQKILARKYDYPEVIIDNIRLTHPLGGFTGNGALSLNQNYQWDGYLELSLENYEKFLNFMVKKNVISTKYAERLRIIFSFLVSTGNIHRMTGGAHVKLEVKNNRVMKGSSVLFEIPDFITPPESDKRTENR